MVKKLKKIAAFKTEADLCVAFLRSVDKRDWIVFNETAGWDILLVRKADGFQIGIEAKLKLNALVFAQVIDSDKQHNQRGPDCRAILAPQDDVQSGINAFCAYIGITIISLRSGVDPEIRAYWQQAFTPRLPKIGDEYMDQSWYPWLPAKRHLLPEYIPDVGAGHPSPIRLSRWKIGAIKIAVLLEDRGYLTRTDFRSIGVDIRMWMPRDKGWIMPSVDHPGFVRGPHFPNFQTMHPRVYQEIKADLSKWRPKNSITEKQAMARLL